MWCRYQACPGDADAHRAGEQLAVDRHPFAQDGLQLVGKRLGLLRRHRQCRYHHELVAAKARDHVALAGRRLQSAGHRLDEAVTGGVAEVVVDGLQPVQVDEQCRNGTWLPRRQSRVHVCQECPAIAESRQIVVLGQVAQLVLCLDASLNLREQRGDRHQRLSSATLHSRTPMLDETEHTGGDVTGQQWRAHHRGSRCRCLRSWVARW